MKINSYFILLLAVVMIGCTSHSEPPPSQSQRAFFTPRNWKAPISKSVPQKKPSPAETKTPAELVIPNEQIIGYASWYGPGFHGKITANGEKYDQNDMTAAHKFLPMNTWVQVTNLENNLSVVVRINDRGPYKKNRIIDLSGKAANQLGFIKQGTARVSLKIIEYPKDFDPSNGLKPYKQTVVQIAVFSSVKRAKNFKRQLAGRYRKIPFMIDTSNNKFRVLAGPYKNRTEANQVAKALKKEGIDNFVRSYKK